MYTQEIMQEAKIVYSQRKSIGIEIKNGGEIILKAPRGTPKFMLTLFVDNHLDWINKTLHKLRAQEEKRAGLKPYSAEDMKALANLAAKIIPPRVEYYRKIIGVTYGRITIRNQKTRWGSCTSKGNLNFNCLLADMPPEVLDSVVVHELCHRKQMNHSRAFYREVYKAYPEYDKWHGWLTKNGGQYMLRAGK